MSALQLLSLVSIAIGVAAILRFIWLDSLRFADHVGEAADPAVLSPRTTRRLTIEAEAARVRDEHQTLPRAA